MDGWMDGVHVVRQCCYGSWLREGVWVRCLEYNVLVLYSGIGMDVCSFAAVVQSCQCWCVLECMDVLYVYLYVGRLCSPCGVCPTERLSCLGCLLPSSYAPRKNYFHSYLVVDHVPHRFSNKAIFILLQQQQIISVPELDQCKNYVSHPWSSTKPSHRMNSDRNIQFWTYNWGDWSVGYGVNRGVNGTILCFCVFLDPSILWHQ